MDRSLAAPRPRGAAAGTGPGRPAASRAVPALGRARRRGGSPRIRGNRAGRLGSGQTQPGGGAEARAQRERARPLPAGVGRGIAGGRAAPPRAGTGRFAGVRGSRGGAVLVRRARPGADGGGAAGGRLRLARSRFPGAPCRCSSGAGGAVDRPRGRDGSGGGAVRPGAAAAGARRPGRRRPGPGRVRRLAGSPAPGRGAPAPVPADRAVPHGRRALASAAAAGGGPPGSRAGDGRRALRARDGSGPPAGHRPGPGVFRRALARARMLPAGVALAARLAQAGTGRRARAGRARRRRAAHRGGEGNPRGALGTGPDRSRRRTAGRGPGERGELPRRSRARRRGPGRRPRRAQRDPAQDDGSGAGAGALPGRAGHRRVPGLRRAGRLALGGDHDEVRAAPGAAAVPPPGARGQRGPPRRHQAPRGRAGDGGTGAARGPRTRASLPRARLAGGCPPLRGASGGRPLPGSVPEAALARAGLRSPGPRSRARRDVAAGARRRREGAGGDRCAHPRRARQEPRAAAPAGSAHPAGRQRRRRVDPRRGGGDAPRRFLLDGPLDPHEGDGGGVPGGARSAVDHLRQPAAERPGGGRGWRGDRAPGRGARRRRPQPHRPVGGRLGDACHLRHVVVRTEEPPWKKAVGACFPAPPA